MNQALPPSKLTNPLVYIITAILLLTATTPAGAIKNPDFLLAASAYDTGSATSILGIALVSIGCMVFLISIARHVAATRRAKKTFSAPVLFDKLNPDAIARLQQRINQAGHTTDTEESFCEPHSGSMDIIDQICEFPEEKLDPEEEFVHSTVQSRDDSYEPLD